MRLFHLGMQVDRGGEVDVEKLDGLGTNVFRQGVVGLMHEKRSRQG